MAGKGCAPKPCLLANAWLCQGQTSGSPANCLYCPAAASTLSPFPKPGHRIPLDIRFFSLWIRRARTFSKPRRLYRPDAADIIEGSEEGRSVLEGAVGTALIVLKSAPVPHGDPPACVPSSATDIECSEEERSMPGDAVKMPALAIFTAAPTPKEGPYDRVWNWLLSCTTDQDKQDLSMAIAAKQRPRRRNM
ncbi:hypothetical protein GGTG_13365 [Gaeumannomyces tritici R3-111a-1]|uniref:Uncharacterized protein n=1 Tax=Gaeumannomyces tritici (strain R3-111a-1) TaxID=644352 RepID=J3PIN6_GAET3|nr:hypothetical protein GGTG_13365 [Gaeumannomyces tritici R3-111a-1]EJT69097.1 hypothetical protein GGTG_13365 [Gaeumannomyces tritici R3-111a-1]